MKGDASIGADDAFRYCRELTRARARNFYHGLKLLPEPRRSALYAIYAWMRAADDIADDGPSDVKEARARVVAFREQTRRALGGTVDAADPILVALRETAARYPIPMEQFDAMLDGQLEDLDGCVYRAFADLRRYCERVASSVGLICIEIWGYDDARARDLAIDRGIAFQLTNILRDFVEDEANGRVYLPAEDFARHHLTPEALRGWAAPERCRRFLEEQIERAESYYRSSVGLDAMIDPSCVPTLWAMTEIYHGLLLRMQSDPAQLVRGPRVRLTAISKGAIAIRARLRSRGAGQAVQ